MSIPDNQIEKPIPRPHCDTAGCWGEVCQETGYCLVCESEEQAAAYEEMWAIDRRLEPPQKVRWDPSGTSWALGAGGLAHAARYDGRMQKIAQAHNVHLFRTTLKAGGSPTWIFTHSSRAMPAMARAGGMTVTHLSRAV